MPSSMRMLGTRPIYTELCLQHRKASLTCIRKLHIDGRARLSKVWAPSGGIAANKVEGMLTQSRWRFGPRR